METMIPIKWPQDLPNLSTHNGKPCLIIKDKNSYSLILGSYSQYLKRLDSLKNEFTLCIRSFYKFLETSKQFHDPVRILSHIEGSEKLTIFLNSFGKKEKKARPNGQLIKRTRVKNQLARIISQKQKEKESMDSTENLQSEFNDFLNSLDDNEMLQRSASEPTLRIPLAGDQTDVTDNHSSFFTPTELNSEANNSIDGPKTDNQRRITICGDEYLSPNTQESESDI